MAPKKNFRKRSHEGDSNNPDDSEDEQHRRMVLEEVKFLQKQRERKNGIPALPSSAIAINGGAPIVKILGKVGEGGSLEDKEDQVLHDTFAQETAVTIEDPNMLNYVERELAKSRGKNIDSNEKEDKDPVDELFIVPNHLKVKKRNSEESSTQWTTGIAEVQLPIEYKLRNIEETEAAKKQLQEKRIAGKTKSDVSIPSSYTADYFHRGQDYTERLKRDHPELYNERGPQDSKASDNNNNSSNNNNNNNDNNKSEGGRRETATDELMLARFRKKEKYRVMRR